MSIVLPFNEVLEVIETLSLDEQETLLTIVQRRLTERTRQKLLPRTAHSVGCNSDSVLHRM